MTFLAQFQQAFYTYRAARAMGCPRHHLRVSGPCLIHGSGRFVVQSGVVLRASPAHPIELYCAAGATLTLGEKCFLNQGAHIACCERVEIGPGALVADEAFLLDGDFHGVGGGPARSAPILVERGAWIGARAIVLKGVTIGAEAVVGAGAVVAHAVPPRSLAVGNPARVVRHW